MQTVAMGWYVYELTGSNALLGFISLMSLGPTLFVSPFAGVLVDRLDKRKVIVATQVFSMLQAGALGTLILTGAAQVWHIVVLSLVLGVVNAFDIPCRQSFMVEIVGERENLPNAIALNSSMFNSARMIGPLIAAKMMEWVGAGTCFLLNSVSYVAVILGLLAMRLERRRKPPAKRHVGRDLREGAAHAFGSVPIRSLLAFLALMSFCSAAYMVLLPAYAKDVLEGNERTYGALYFAIGLGALVAAIRLASRRSVLGLGRVLFAACMLFSLCLGLIGVAPTYWVAMPLFAGVGFGMMTHMGSCNTLVQTVVEDRYRGRVMSFYAMSFMVPTPIGSLIAGAGADYLGVRWLLVQFGLVGVLGALLFYRALPTVRKHLRPIYLEKGIIVAEGAAIPETVMDVGLQKSISEGESERD